MVGRHLLVIAASLVLAALAVASWLTVPAVAPALVLSTVRHADPVARALIALHGDGFSGFAANPAHVAVPPMDPWRWALALQRMPGDADAALIRATGDPHPGRAYLAVALLAECRDVRCSWAAREGRRWTGSFAPASDAALLDAAQPGRPLGTRILAQRVLAGQGVDAALPLILPGLEDPDALTRARCAHLIGHWGDTWDLHAWDRSGRGWRSNPRAGVFGARTAVPALIRRLAREDEEPVRRALVAALALIRDESADSAIVAAITRDGIGSSTYGWLATWSSPRIAALLATLPEPPPNRWD